MKKIFIIPLISVFFLSACARDKAAPQNAVLSGEQAVYEQTYNISKNYVALRYRTDNVLINAEQYPDYEGWNSEMTAIIKGWKSLEESAAVLEKSAEEMAREKTGFKFTREALAYDKEEISRIVDKAPMGKKIMTLAKHLGVDAKRAQLILNQDQAMVSSEIWGGEGDTYETMEKSAIVVKDGCKVAGFVGGVVLSGGTSAIMAGSVLTKAAVIVSGADLVLEVTEDGANIALGNDNKVSAIVGEARKVSGPIATVLTITDIPNNLSSGFDKFNAVMDGLDQFRSAAQDGNILGINLPVYTGETKDSPISVAVMKPEEVGEWLKENGKETPGESVAEVEKILGINDKIDRKVEQDEKSAPQKAEDKEVKEEVKTESTQPRMPFSEFNDLSDGGG